MKKKLVFQVDYLISTSHVKELEAGLGLTTQPKQSSSYGGHASCGHERQVVLLSSQTNIPQNIKICMETDLDEISINNYYGKR